MLTKRSASVTTAAEVYVCWSSSLQAAHHSAKKSIITGLQVAFALASSVSNGWGLFATSALKLAHSIRWPVGLEVSDTGAVRRASASTRAVTPAALSSA